MHLRELLDAMINDTVGHWVPWTGVSQQAGKQAWRWGPHFIVPRWRASLKSSLGGHARNNVGKTWIRIGGGPMWSPSRKQSRSTWTTTASKACPKDR